MISELDSIVLETDLPDQGLRRGDIGTVVLVHDGGAGFDVEFSTLFGESVAIITLPREQVRPVRHREIAHARAIA